jgi:hypothetical protein
MIDHTISPFIAILNLLLLYDAINGKKYNIRNSSSAALFGHGVVSMNSMNSVFVSIELSAVEPVDSNLEECIIEL